VEAVKPGALGGLAAGRFEGRISYHKEVGAAGSWSGQGLLRQARWQPEGLASPVRITQARLRWGAGQLRVEPMAGSLGDVEFAGVCWRREQGAFGVRHGCQVRIPELDLAELEQWSQPAQRPSRWAALRRALSLSEAPAATWLGSVAVEGTLRIDHLRAGRWEWRNVRSRAQWSDGVLLLDSFRGTFGGGTVTGALKADFNGAAPRYGLQASGREVDLAQLAAAAALPDHFERGTIDARVGLEAQGRTIEELIAKLRLHGVFEAHSVALGHMRWEQEEAEAVPDEIRSLEGGFIWTPAGLDIEHMRMTAGRNVYLGRGSIWGRPRVLFELAAGEKKTRVVSEDLVASTSSAP
jgi:hypothetical protein